ncbi:KH domain-containing, RNA-binding, signal transduction-associated protein 3 isoform X1 [Tachysurus ichikawai]
MQQWGLREGGSFETIHGSQIEKVQKGEEKEDEKFIDVVINKNMKLGQKVLIPVKQFPKLYFKSDGQIVNRPMVALSHTVKCWWK